MTRSIFDPTGPDAEHGGSRNLGPEADNISHMPPDVIDGKTDEEEPGEQDQDSETGEIAQAESDLRQNKQNPDQS